MRGNDTSFEISKRGEEKGGEATPVQEEGRSEIGGKRETASPEHQMTFFILFFSRSRLPP